jgi:hypothetical protein
MSDQEQKDIIVVARTGYSVLLEVDGRMLSIDCYSPVNLSNIFSADILEKCSSLSAHLKDGNLIFFEDGVTGLSKDVTAPVKIKSLREETAQHILSQYDQAERDAKRTNIELETRANIEDNTRKYIQEQVQENKEAILRRDRKFLVKTAQTADDIDAFSAARQNAMTMEELSMKISMDVTQEEFVRKQVEAKEKIATGGTIDEERAEKEIAKQKRE